VTSDISRNVGPEPNAGNLYSVCAAKVTP